MSFRQGIDDIPTGSPPMIGKMLSVAEWLDYVASYQFTGVAADRVVLHHTYIPDETTWRGLASMRGMQSFYRGKGWNAAPHIYVAPEGIWLFTPLNNVGIHAGTGNAGYWHGRLAWYSIGLEMVGFFDKKVPAGSVWEQARAVLGSLSKKFGKAPEQAISFHRDYTNEKTCPGTMVTKPWVFAEVNAWLAGSTNLGLDLPVVAPPRISEATFTRVLRAAKSPAADLAASLYRVATAQGIDPAIALAFFGHESSYGTAGLTKEYNLKNWGNVRTPEDPSLGLVLAIAGRDNFAKYPTWEAGLLDWCKRLKGPKYAGSGLHTVRTILPKYAPSSDSNAPQAYADAVLKAVAQWQTEEKAQPKTWPITVTADALNLRQGPATHYPRVRLLHKSEHVIVDGTKDEGEGEWYHAASGEGFFSKAYTVPG